MRILVTGAAGMIGSHAAEFFARRGDQVVALDNLMRSRLFGSEQKSVEYNWDFLSRYPGITRQVGDVRSDTDLKQALGGGVDAVIHAAGQPGVSYSLQNPAEDFSINALGTLSVLEAVRRVSPNARLVYCSTNKVYGQGVDALPLKADRTRYRFSGKIKAIPETFGIDRTGHTPYGASKYTADLYVQEYAHAYGLPTGVFRMSCIYGPRQFGFEDQGWLAWFIIRALRGEPITIYGDGRQVRDVLFVSDLIRAFDSFLKSKLPHGVFNMGGGPKNTLSLLELLEQIKKNGLSLPPIKHAGWRMFDQKVYVSDIARVSKALKWAPQVNVSEGISKLVHWVRANPDLLK